MWTGKRRLAQQARWDVASTAARVVGIWGWYRAWRPTKIVIQDICAYATWTISQWRASATLCCTFSTLTCCCHKIPICAGTNTLIISRVRQRFWHNQHSTSVQTCLGIGKKIVSHCANNTLCNHILTCLTLCCTRNAIRTNIYKWCRTLSQTLSYLKNIRRIWTWKANGWGLTSKAWRYTGQAACGVTVKEGWTTGDACTWVEVVRTIARKAVGKVGRRTSLAWWSTHQALISINDCHSYRT